MQPSAEFTDILRDYILIHVILDVMKVEKKHLPELGLKIPSLLADEIEKTEERALRELEKIRAQLRKEQIKILQHIKSKDGIMLKYVWRGYTNEQGMVGLIVKGQVENMLSDWRKG